MDQHFNQQEAEDFLVLEKHHSMSFDIDLLFCATDYALTLLSSFKNVIKWAILDPNPSIAEKCAKLNQIDDLLNDIRPTLLIKQKDHRSDDGTTIEQLVDGMLAFIQANGPEPVDIKTFMEEQEKAEDPSVPLEVHIRSSLANIVHCLKEMKEVLARADGDLDKNFEMGEESPFLKAEYITARKSFDRLYVRVEYYPSNLYLTQSEKCNKNSTKMIDWADFIKNDRDFMAKYTEEVDFLIENHIEKFYDREYLTNESIDTVLMAAYDYLGHFKTRVNINQFNDEMELEMKILSNIDGFSFMLHSLPMNKIFVNETENFEDLIGISDEILSVVENISLHKKLTKLKTVAVQMLNINGKNCSGGRAIDRRTHKIFPLSLDKMMKPDVITKRSSKDWKNKFETIKTKEDVLKSCYHDKCCICFDKFADILENSSTSDGDLAILPKCLHVFCIGCTKDIVLEAFTYLR